MLVVVLVLALRLHYSDCTESELLEHYDKFFRAYAEIWCMNIRKEFAEKLLAVDPHAPAVARINGALAHIKEFYQTYNVCEGDGMFLKDDARMNIW